MIFTKNPAKTLILYYDSFARRYHTGYKHCVPTGLSGFISFIISTNMASLSQRNPCRTGLCGFFFNSETWKVSKNLPGLYTSKIF